jgi:hypothetical protein
MNQRETIAMAEDELERIDNTLSKFNVADIKNLDVDAFHAAYAADYADERLFGADMQVAIADYVANKENIYDPANINIQHMQAYCESLANVDFLENEPATNYVIASYAHEMAVSVDPNSQIAKETGEFKEMLEEKFPVASAEASQVTGFRVALEYLEEKGVSPSEAVKQELLAQALSIDNEKGIAFEKDDGFG